MEQVIQEVVSGNKLIAGFMGLRSDLSAIDWVNQETHIGYSNADLKYHSSWDWLMPVVEKIGELATFETDGHDELYVNAGSVLSLQVCQPITLLWERIVDFITWYTQNKTK